MTAIEELENMHKLSRKPLGDVVRDILNDCQIDLFPDADNTPKKAQVIKTITNVIATAVALEATSQLSEIDQDTIRNAMVKGYQLGQAGRNDGDYEHIRKLSNQHFAEYQKERGLVR